MTHLLAWFDLFVCDITRMFQNTTSLQHTAVHCSILQHTATHCNTSQHNATHCNTLQHTATHCITLQHTATHCNTLQHTALHCTCVFLNTQCLMTHARCKIPNDSSIFVNDSCTHVSKYHTTHLHVSVDMDTYKSDVNSYAISFFSMM